MKIVFSLCGDMTKASSRVRGFWIARALGDIGHQCRLRVTDSKLQLLCCALDILWADAVIFQKTYSRYHFGLMRLARFLGKKVYVDIDDLPSRSGSVSTLKNFARMVGAAHAVFAGSDELAKDVVDAGGRACLVPTGVQVSSYVQRDNAMDSSVNRLQPCIGWIGNGNHYEGDLIDILLPALHDLAKICRFRLKLVGVAGSELLHAATSAITDFEVELVDQLDWSDPALIAGQLGTFDVGVYPLLDNPFNTRKCGFKALEYMATGIPVVASGNGANAQIVVHSETGYLASNKEDWVGYLSRLVADVNLRQSLGKAGRIRVESEFDVSRIARKISSILMEVGVDA